MPSRVDERPENWAHDRTIFYKVVVFILVTSGFTYQTALICDEYFRYPTTTMVTILSYLPTTTPPSVVIRIPKSPHRLQMLKDFFANLPDDLKFVMTNARKAYKDDRRSTARGDKFVQVRKYLESNYHLHFRTREEIRLVPQNLYAFNQMMYHFLFASSILRLAHHYGSYQMFMTSYHGDMEGVQRTPLSVVWNHGWTISAAVVTYSVKLTKLAPPPYDTNCKDYRLTRYTSSENCLSTCLNDFLSHHGFIIETTVMPREKYENSTLRLIPYYMKSLYYSGNDWSGEVNASFIKKSEIGEEFPKEHNQLFQKLADIFPSYKKHWRICKQYCSRPDCYTESIVPQMIASQGGSPNSRNGINANKTVLMLKIGVFPPKDQIITVTSVSKNNMLDFIVYILSCLSFWYGFCPLSAAGKAGKAKVKKVTKSIQFVTTLSNQTRNRSTRDKGGKRGSGILGHEAH